MTMERIRANSLRDPGDAEKQVKELAALLDGLLPSGWSFGAGWWRGRYGLVIVPTSADAKAEVG